MFMRPVRRSVFVAVVVPVMVVSGPAVLTIPIFVLPVSVLPVPVLVTVMMPVMVRSLIWNDLGAADRDADAGGTVDDLDALDKRALRLEDERRRMGLAVFRDVLEVKGDAGVRFAVTQAFESV
jgi:hypothetical protein